MKKLTITTETAYRTETFTRRFETSAQVEEFTRQLRESAPAGSTTTIKTKTV